MGKSAKWIAVAVGAALAVGGCGKPQGEAEKMQASDAVLKVAAVPEEAGAWEKTAGLAGDSVQDGGGSKPENAVPSETAEQAGNPETAAAEDAVAWLPSKEQTEAAKKKYPGFYQTTIFHEAAGCDEDGDHDGGAGRDENVKKTKAGKPDSAAQKHMQNLEAAEAFFCDALKSDHVGCGMVSARLDEPGAEQAGNDDDYVVKISCGSTGLDGIFGKKALTVDIARTDKAYRQQRLGEMKLLLTGAVCEHFGSGRSAWRCIAPDGCGESESKRCKLFARYSEDAGGCVCDGVPDPGKGFACQLAGQALYWTCSGRDGCEYMAERVPHYAFITCGVSSEAYKNIDRTPNGCYCNGARRNPSDPEPCVPPKGQRECAHISSLPYRAELKMGEVCELKNGCRCNGSPCPKSGVCTEVACLDPVTGKDFGAENGWFTSGIYRQCMEPSGCPCGSSANCAYGAACLNGWFCSDGVETVVKNGGRLVFDDGRRYQSLFESRGGEYRYGPCSASVLDGLDASVYACMYSFRLEETFEGCFGDTDEMDFAAYGVARCAHPDGCPCGTGLCPAFARCEADACFYDEMYEAVMCAAYDDSSENITDRVANRVYGASRGNPLDPAENIDVSGRCIKNGKAYPAKFADYGVTPER